MRYHRSIARNGAIAAYFAVQILWIWIVDQSVFFGSDVAGVVILSVLGLANLALGLTVARWWSPMLPFLTVLLALPFGYPSGNYHEPLPLWFGALLLAPVEVVLIAFGVAGRKLWERLRSPRPA